MARIYRSQTDLIELMIDHGLAVLARDGLGGKPLTFTRVFDHIEAAGLPRVKKGSVLGPNRPWVSQEDYVTDVELAAIHRWADTSQIDPLVAAEAAAVLSCADVTTLDGREATVRELCRRVAAASLRSNRSHPLFQIVVALWGRVASSPHGDRADLLGVALREARRRSVESGVAFTYRPLAQFVGMRGRDGLWSQEEALRLASQGASALAEGYALDMEFAGDDEVFLLPTGPGGEMREWTTYAMGAEAIITRFLELDPDWCAPGA